MRSLQNRAGSDGYDSEQVDNRDTGSGAKSNAKELIVAANTSDFQEILKYYGINLDEYNKKCVCPFKFHIERTPSFQFYKNTNSFYCWGCKNGGGPVEFVSLIDDISKTSAAHKILNNFDEGCFEINSYDDRAAKNEASFDFSNRIREYIHKNVDDVNILGRAEKICIVYDTINAKHQLSSDGVKALSRKLLNKLK